MMRRLRLLLILIAALLLAGTQTRLGETPAAEAAFPGENGRIMYVSACTGASSIVTVNPNGSDPRTIPTEGLYPRAVAVSANGLRIAFEVWTGGQVYVMNSDGSGLTLVSMGSEPVWSPDGTKIALRRQATNVSTDIWVITLDGSEPDVNVTSGSMGIKYHAAWSPDGTRIAYVGYAGQDPFGDGYLDIFTVDPTGNNKTRVTNSYAQESDFSWSPDGTRIAAELYDDDDGTLLVTGIVLFDLGGGATQLTTSTSGFHQEPTWSPDGTKIAFADTGVGGIWVTGAAGGSTPENIVVGGCAYTMDWAPSTLPLKVEFTQAIQQLQTVDELQASLGSGSSASEITPQAFPGANGLIAFVSACTQPFSIVTVNPNGSDPRTIPTPGLSPRSVAVSADGRKVAFQPESGGQVYVMNVDGSELRPVSMGSQPAWSPDGMKIALIRIDSGVADIWVITVDGSEPDVNVTSGSIGVKSHPAWSPDGTRIAYVGYAGQDPFGDGYVDIFTVDPTGNDKTNVTNSYEGESDLSWSPDGTHIVAKFAGFDDLDDNTPDEEPGIVSFDLGGVFTRLITSDFAYNPRWSPDGTKIAYIDQGGLWVMGAIAGSTPENIASIGQCAYSLDWAPSTLPLQVEITQAIQQLQPLSALQGDLAGDGKPPVPIVAGKAAVMRVYFGEVDATTGYLVEVTGEVNQSENVTVDPGCTAVDRRRQANGCSSLDFYFTPPVGDWTVSLKVSAIADAAVLVDEDFHLTSVDTDGLIVKYLPICVRLTPGAVLTCPSNFVFTSAPDLMRKLYPAADGELLYEPLPVPAWFNDAPLANRAEESALAAELRQFYEWMSVGGFVADQVAAWLPEGGSAIDVGLSDPVWMGSTGRVSWQVDESADDLLNTEHTLAHEIGHNLGLRHTNLPDGCGARDAGTGWPYSDSTIQEVGFDVAARQVMPESKKDLMTYCTPPGSDIWISPYTYNTLLESNFEPQGAGAVPAGAASSQFLLVTGTAQADGSAATLDSSYVIDSSVPAEPSDPLGNYCLHFIGVSTVDYCFTMEFEDHRSHEPIDRSRSRYASRFRPEPRAWR